MAKTEKKPKDPNAPKTPRKPAFRVTASGKKHLENALNDYLGKINDMPDHPLVDKSAVIAEIESLRNGLCKQPATTAADAPAADAATEG